MKGKETEQPAALFNFANSVFYFTFINFTKQHSAHNSLVSIMKNNH